jgi:hypothetical protein
MEHASSRSHVFPDRDHASALLVHDTSFLIVLTKNLPLLGIVAVAAGDE